ncbi:MAG: TraB/GumN family protein [Caulobacteraceae bacterium]
MSLSDVTTPLARLKSLAVSMALVVAVGLGAPVLAKPPMWIATRGHAKLVLFGSVHLLPAGLDWTPPELVKAEGEARELWFELPIDQATDARATRLAALKGALPGDATLWSLLSPAAVAKVRRAAAAVGEPAEDLTRLRPWLADVSLSLRADLLAGAQARQGVEQRIQAAAPLAVRRRALETADEQIAFLADAPVADQIASLSATAEEILDDPDVYARVLAEWMAGKLASLEVDAFDRLRRASPDLYRRLITARNRRWARLLGASAGRDGPAVVVVGMGHMIGPNGLPALLRQAGWTVTGPVSGD